MVGEADPSLLKSHTVGEADCVIGILGDEVSDDLETGRLDVLHKTQHPFTSFHKGATGKSEVSISFC